MKEGREVTIGVPLGPKQPIFTTKEEDEMVVYLKHMEERLLGLTTLDLRRLALAVRYFSIFKNCAPYYCKAHNFNTDKQMAGVDWLKGFLRRHPDLSIRKPSHISS